MLQHNSRKDLPNQTIITDNETCRTRRLSIQTINSSNTVYTPIVCNGDEQWDGEAMHDLVTNADRVTVVRQQQTILRNYLMFGYLSYASNVTGRRVVSINGNIGGVANASVGERSCGANTTVGNPTRITVCHLFSMDLNDYAQLCALQNSGAPVDTQSGQTFVVFLTRP